MCRSRQKPAHPARNERESGRNGPKLVSVNPLNQKADFLIHRVVLQNRVAQPSLPIATAVSTIRLEKPHSLSYQLSTRTSLPSITLVCFRSKVELAGLWL